MSTWIDTAAVPPGSGPPHQVHPGTVPAGPPRLPSPPAVVWAAAGLAVVTTVLVVVAGTTGTLTDLVAQLGLRRDDASVLATTLAATLAAGLLGGAAGLLTGHGGGLLRVTGIAVACLAALAVVVIGLIRARGGWELPVLSVLLVLGAGTATVLATRPSADWWTAASERRSAERAIEGLSARPRRAGTQQSVRGPGSLVASVALVVGVVVMAALLVTSVTPDVTGGPHNELGSIGEPGPIPVEPGDLEWERGLALLAEECADGDLGSCDDLYRESDLYGDYEEYGSTCGGRATRAFSGDCVESFE